MIASFTGISSRARTTDLSRGGCYIDTTSPYPLGTEMQLRLKTKNSVFEAQAKVVVSHPGMGMGVFFTSVQPGQIPVLKNWVDNLSRGLPAEPDRMSDTARVEEPQTIAEGVYVLNELIILLMRKRVLTETEGKELIRRLHNLTEENQMYLL